MQITVTFNSLEEFMQCMRPMEGFAEETQERIEEPRQEVQATAPEPEPAPEAPAVTEDFRVEVRKAMAKLNKQTGQNTAKDLITAIGFTKLSEVPLELLPELMERVKEAANA